MEQLTQQLDKLINRLDKAKDFREQLTQLRSVFPFSEYEYIISALLATNKMSFEDYLEIRDTYIDRNIFLYVFEISAPTVFGTTWTLSQLRTAAPELEKPTKANFPGFTNEFDLLYKWRIGKSIKDIRIELKASRAVDAEKASLPLYMKALTSDSQRPFDMNFQQLKPKCCDVFIWIAAWRDEVKYWIMSSDEVKNNKYYSTGQHRGNVDEGQLHLNLGNIGNFKQYLTPSNKLVAGVIAAYKRQYKIK